jgi:hypothetical protein
MLRMDRPPDKDRWIERFVAAAASPGDAVDAEYHRLLAEQLAEPLQLMEPEAVAAALLNSRSLPVRGILNDSDRPATTFGDL